MKNLICLLIFLSYSILLNAQDCDNWLKVNDEISGVQIGDLDVSGKLFQNNLKTTTGITISTGKFYSPNFINYYDVTRAWKDAVTLGKIKQNIIQLLPNPLSKASSLVGNDSYNVKLDKEVIAGFSAPDTVCINEPVNITNTSEGASNYLWSFCSEFSTKPTKVKSISGGFSMPVFMDYGLDDNGNYYGIVTNHIAATIIRMNFGNSLLNTPTSENLGNFGGIIPQQVEGVQLEHVNGKWYAIAVGGGNQYPNASPRIIKLDFGNSLANTPTATNWGNIGNLNLPIDLHIEQENGNYYGFTMNVYSNTITRFDFGNDFINPPVGTNLGNIGGLSYPDGFNIVKNNNNWYSFVVNSTTNTITRLDFGSSLTNTPTPTIINNLKNKLSGARDITMINACDGIIAYTINANDNKLFMINFGSDITNTQPVATYLGNYNFQFPHSFSDFFTVNGEIYMFVPNVNANRIDLLKYSGCSDIQSSTQQNPDPVSYTQPGTYQINLMVDIGLPTQTSYCKQIVVINCDTICKLNAGFTYQQVTCDPKILQFQDTSVNADSIRWDFGFGKQDTSRDPVVEFPGYGNYIVHLYAKTNAGCLDTATDTIDVDVKIDSAIITNDTVICAGSSIQLSAITGLNYCWSPKGSLSDSTIQNPVATPNQTTTYYLDILTGNNQPVIRDSIIIKVNPLPVVDAGPDDSVCVGATAQLNATGAIKYKWKTSDALSDTTIANPVASPLITTNFFVTGYDNYGCSDTDNVIITVLDLPVMQLVNDTAICKGGTVLLEANVAGKNSYRWMPSVGLSDPDVFNPVASPADTTEYFVSVSDSNQCVATDSVTVNVLPRPVVSTINDTNVCYGQPLILATNTQYANMFSWSPPTGLDNTTIEDPVAAVMSTTKYIVTAGNGYCSEKDSVTLTVLALPDVIAGNDTTVCGNATAQLSASGAISYSWQPVIGLSDPNISNPIADPGITTTYFVTGVDANNCNNIDSTTVIVTPAPAFQLTPQNLSICIGNTAELKASGGDVFSWTPSQTVVNPDSAETNVFPSETTTYTVIITDTTCKVTGSLFSTVTVKDKPVVTITKSNDVDCINWQAQLTATGGNRFKWSPNQNISNPAISNPVVSPTADTWYFVDVTDANGCSSKDSVLVKSILNPEAKVFEVPSAFTPNHDGLNDCFEVKYWGPADVFDLSVYNRMGNLVFHTNNINACWDGNYKGLPQPQGVYVYKINISSRCSNGLVQRKGTVVLIR